MRLSLFKYALPSNLIAQYPPDDRSNSRLMVVHRESGKIEHRKFTDVIDYIEEGDVCVFNDSYMMNSLIFGVKSNESKPISVFLQREINADEHIWDVETGNARKVRVGNKFYFKDFDMIGEIISNTSVRGRMMKITTNKTNEELKKEILEKGFAKLPKYIKRDPNKDDVIYTKSVFAKNPGSINHVFGGLHFDEKLIDQMKLKGIFLEYLTYYTNNSTTNKFDTKTITNATKIHETFYISEDTVNRLNLKKSKNSRIFAVGYSALMGLENSYISALGKLTTFNSDASKTPYCIDDFNVCDGYLTNFYETGSPFLMVDMAFCGEELLLKAYEEAIKEKYGFLLFGDSLLII